jgi:hypothetical protein
MAEAPINSKQLPSDQVVGNTIEEGLQYAALSTAVGLTVGGLASIVLSRGGGASRKVITGFGGGIGLGSAWTRCSINLEEILKKP